MAQGPNAMQEPSMDELLASIREIIEENTGPSPNKNVNRQEISAPEATITASKNSSLLNASGSSSNNMGSFNESARDLSNEQQLDKRSVQRPEISRENPPVRDAMNALAARIGLRQDERSDQKASNVTVQNEGPMVPAAPTAAVLRKVPAERDSQSPSDNPVAVPPRTLVQNAPNAHSIHLNSGNLNSGALGAENPHNNALQVSNGGRPLNVSEQPAQPRNALRANNSSNQGAQLQPMGQQHAMQALKSREISPQRDLRPPREAYGNENQQPIQTAGAVQSQAGRHLPPQPRMGGTAARPNHIANPALHNDLRDSAHDENALATASHLQAERNLEVKQAPRVSHPLSPSHNIPLGGQATHEGMSHPATISTPTNRPLGEGDVSKIATQDHRETLDGNGRQRGVLNSSSASQNGAPKNLQHPRSAPQKPHFLSHALRSAFLSVPAEKSPFQTASSLPQVPLRPQTVSARDMKQQTRVELKAAEMIEAEVKREMDNLDKALEADFEKSAENLLRPYIAKWLDEHFSELFEKVLREEIKRVIEAQLR